MADVTDRMLLLLLQIFVLVSTLLCHPITACSDGSLGLLLVSTDSPLEGDLAICMGGQWGKVRSCPSPGFPGSAEAVACTQLGLSPTNVSVESSLQLFFVIESWCTGSESRLLDCNNITALDNCSSDPVTLNCQVCNNSDVRIIGDESNLRIWGEAQICHQHHWGAVCNDNWNLEDARVFCRQLGYSPWDAYAGQNSSSLSYIHLDEVECTGTETRLEDCAHNGFGVHDCVLEVVAYIECHKKTCIDDDIRLVNGETELDGRVEVCKEGAWGVICDPFWDASDAAVICRQLNSSSEVVYATTDAERDRTMIAEEVFIGDVDCDGSETFLIGCDHIYEGVPIGCNDGNFAGAVCQQVCNNSEVRIIGSENDLWIRGEAQICYQHHWGAVCIDQWNVEDARVLCRQLGYSPWYAYAGQTSSSLSYIHLDEVECAGTETRLADCAHDGFGNQDCILEEVAYIICQKKTCIDGDIRLVNGETELDGRVEVCKEGAWGVICSPLWDASDAAVVCRQLNSSNEVAYAITDADRDGMIAEEAFIGEVNCNGSETLLTGCDHIYEGVPIGCNNNNAAGAVCQQVCNNSDVRIIGDESNLWIWGEAQICHQHHWGAVCNNNWNLEDARVFCRQLGYSPWYVYAGQTSSSLSYIHLDEVECTGTETRLEDCAHSGFGVHDCVLEVVAYIACQKKTCIDDDIRLVNGETELDGRVEVCKEGSWGVICDPFWDASDATVVCRQLNSSSEVVYATTDAERDRTMIEVFIGDVDCDGSETLLIGCDPIYEGVPIGCDDGNFAGAVCQQVCNNSEVRIIGSENDLWIRGEAQICYQHHWGAVCIDQWNVEDARVLCRQLGYSPWYAYAGQTSSSLSYIHLDEVECAGTETRLADCAHDGFGNQDCILEEVAYIICQKKTCIDGDIRLVNGETELDGRVEVCKEGSWGVICGSLWDASDAAVICRQLNGSSEVAYATTDANGGDSVITEKVFISEVNCDGSENLLTGCDHIYEGVPITCNNVNYAGAVCQQVCNNSDVRIFGNKDDLSIRGEAQICHQHHWGAVCIDQWNLEDAKVLCRQLGYSPWYADDAETSSSLSYIHLDEVECTGTETRLEDCVHNDFGDHDCILSEVAYAECYSNTCRDGDIRLSSGETELDGRVEVCKEGAWGVICSPLWDASDAAVVCRQLNSSSKTAYAITGYEGNGGDTEDVFISSVNCKGTETHLTSCDHIYKGVPINCDDNDHAGVICRQGFACNSSDVRLVAGTHNLEGRVEVCYDGTWGTVCRDQWDSADAAVVCRQLGFSPWGAEIKVSFGPGQQQPIFLNGVQCDGIEQRLADCSTREDVNVHSCGHSDDVGVLCKERNCSDGDIRLLNGSSSKEGRVELCVERVWSAICATSWETIDTAVVCRQLGYSPWESMIGDYGTKADGLISLGEVNCIGDELLLESCSHGAASEEQCSEGEEAGVQCQEKLCRDGEVELIDDGAGLGLRVSVCVEGTWGAVSSSGWDAGAAEVVCNNTTDQNSAEVYLAVTGVMENTSRIILSEVSCKGTESSLFDCQHTYLGVDKSFYSTSHARVLCNRGNECANIGSVRLVNGSSEFEGRVELCYLGYWNSICQYDMEASVLCHELGFSTSGTANSNFGIGRGLVIPWPFNCSGSEVSLIQCVHLNDSYGSKCEQAEAVAGVVCTEPIAIASLQSRSGIYIGVASAIVCVIGLITAAGLICFAIQRQRKKRDVLSMERIALTNPVRAPHNPYDNAMFQNLAPEVVEAIKTLPRDLIIPNSNIRLLDTLGQGEFGIVYRAHVVQSPGKPKSLEWGRRMSKSTIRVSFDNLPNVVAVKTLKGFFNNREVIEMAKESVRMAYLDHPNVLSMIGVCVDAGPAPYLVMPFMANGSLHSYIKKYRPELVLEACSDSEELCTLQKRLIDMCSQVSRGMEYLASEKLVHRDLAARNCMIDITGVIKVADFGLSETTTAKDYIRQDQDKTIKLPIKWMAPESIGDGIFSEKTDVWAYGVTCWEIYTGGKSPYPGVHPITLLNLLESGERLWKPKNLACCSGMYGIMLKCWQHSPDDRPTFSALVEQISQVMEPLADYLDVTTFVSLKQNTTTTTEDTTATTEDGLGVISNPLILDVDAEHAFDTGSLLDETGSEEKATVFKQDLTVTTEETGVISNPHILGVDKEYVFDTEIDEADSEEKATLLKSAQTTTTEEMGVISILDTNEVPSLVTGSLPDEMDNETTAVVVNDCGTIEIGNEG